MLTLRLSPVGKKHQRVFRVVLQKKRSKLKGKSFERLGYWDPRLKSGKFDSEKIRFYIEHGAQISDTLWNLLIKNAVIKGTKRKITVKTTSQSKEGENIIETPKEIAKVTQTTISEKTIPSENSEEIGGES